MSFFDGLGSLAGFLLRDIFSIVERQKLVIAGIHTLQGILENAGNILTGDREIAVDHPDKIAFAHLHAPDLYRAHRSCDLGSLDMLNRFSHILTVSGEVGLEVETEKGRNTLRKCLAGNNIDLFWRQINHLLGAENHITIIRQDDYLVGWLRINGGEKFFDARVHGLAA